jgi:cell division protein ZapA
VAQIEVSINGRTYQVACDDGEEEHLLNLADYVDRKVTELTKSIGQVGEARLMLMAGLVIADELAETVDKLETAQKSTSAASPDSVKANNALAEAATDALSTVAQRIEGIAANLEKS